MDVYHGKQYIIAFSNLSFSAKKCLKFDQESSLENSKAKKFDGKYEFTNVSFVT